MSNKTLTMSLGDLDDYLEAFASLLCKTLEFTGPLSFEYKVSDTCTIKATLEKKVS